jgi:hypothetical protein
MCDVCVEVNSTLGWDTGDEALGATRNSESDHCQTLAAALRAAAAREAAGWAQVPNGPTLDLREGSDRGCTPTHSPKATKRVAS